MHIVECKPMTWGNDTFRGWSSRFEETKYRGTTQPTGPAEWVPPQPAPRQIKLAVPWKQTRSGQPLRSKFTTRESTRGYVRQK